MSPYPMNKLPIRQRAKMLFLNHKNMMDNHDLSQTLMYIPPCRRASSKTTFSYLSVVEVLFEDNQVSGHLAILVYDHHFDFGIF